MSGDKNGRDITKSRGYAILDVSIRTISAIGILIIGLAGFLLQRSTANNHDEQVRKDREARKYIAELRSLTELEVALDDVWKPRNRHLDRDDDAQADLGFAARSLFVPDREPNVIIKVFFFVDGSTHGRQLRDESITTTLRAAALMVAEQLEAEAIVAANREPMSLSLSDDSSFMVLEDSKGFHTVLLSNESRPLWRKRIGPRISGADLQAFPVSRLAFNLSVTTNRVGQILVLDHPELADRYVDARDAVRKMRGST